MKTLWLLATKSIWHRKGTVGIVVLSVAISFALLVSVGRLRVAAKSSFENTISGTDFIVGARGSGVQLLLYSVFRLGEPVTDISWTSYKGVLNHPDVAWAVPIALGDSVRGHRVIGTTSDYFLHYRYGQGTGLEFDAGQSFDTSYGAVLGSEAARALKLDVGQHFMVQHGIDKHGHAHDHADFEVVGILKATGTPVDQSVHVSLKGLASIHTPGSSSHDENHAHDAAHEASSHDSHSSDSSMQVAEIERVSAVLVGLRSKLGFFRVQGWINSHADEPLMAVMPARAFQQVWSTVGVAANTLTVVGALVALAGIVALAAVLLAMVNERRREMALLRSVGASPSKIAALIIGEGVAIAFISVLAALVAVSMSEFLFAEILGTQLGIRLIPALVTISDLKWGFVFIVSAAVVSLLPAITTYRFSLSDGLVPRL